MDWEIGPGIDTYRCLVGTLADAGGALAIQATADVADDRSIRYEFHAGTYNTISCGRCDYTDFWDQVKSGGKNDGAVCKLDGLFSIGRWA